MGKKDKILSRFYLQEEIKDWAKYLQEEENEQQLKQIRINQETGRPLGEEDFVRGLESVTGQELVKKKPGPKKQCFS